jgi:hypothetical protein
MLVGAFWPCAHIRCSGRPRRCPCGYKGKNLRLHFVFGDAGDGIACTVAGPERADYKRRVTARFRDEGQGWLIGENDQPSIAKLARWLGGQGLSKELADGLPHDFIATFGEYARRARAEGVLDKMVIEATANEDQQTGGAADAGEGSETEGERNDPDGEPHDSEAESDDDLEQPSHDEDDSA